MLPVTRTRTGVGNSPAVVFDVMRNPFNVGIGAVVIGTVTYTVYHTFDDIINLGIAGCTWFAHDDPALVAATGNANSNYAYPVTGSYVAVSAGTGSVTVTYVQAGLRTG